MPHRQALLVVRSRQVRLAESLGPNRSALVRVLSARRVFRRRWASTACESRRDPRSRLRSPRLRAAKFCSVCVMAFWASRLSVGSARKEEGYPRAFTEIGTRPPDRWGNAGRSTAPAPQSKPVAPASRLVAQIAPLVASGLRAENPGRRASSCSTLLRLRGYANQTSRVCLGSSAGAGIG